MKLCSSDNHFCCLLFFKEYLNPQVRIKRKMTNEDEVSIPTSLFHEEPQGYLPHLWMWFNCLKTTKQPRRDRVLLTNNSLGVTGTHLIYYRKIKCQYILTYFYKPFRALSLSRNFSQFSLKALHVTMNGEHFKIYGV